MVPRIANRGNKWGKNHIGIDGKSQENGALIWFYGGLMEFYVGFMGFYVGLMMLYVGLMGFHEVYPLDLSQKTMENHHCSWDNSVSIAIVNSYGKLPEGKALGNLG